MSQKERIIKYLQDFGSITPLEAMRDLGIMRLAARISELVRAGWNIIRETESSKKQVRTDHAVREISPGINGGPT